jgi:hypothetical protein
MSQFDQGPIYCADEATDEHIKNDIPQESDAACSISQYHAMAEASYDRSQLGLEEKELDVDLDPEDF